MLFALDAFLLFGLLTIFAQFVRATYPLNQSNRQ